VGDSIYTSLTLLAEAANPGPPGGFLISLLPIIAIGLVFYWLLIAPQRRDQKKRQALLNALKESDRVLTVGGIYGVVTNVNRDRGQATIRVDDSNNTKIRVALGSISQVLTEETSSDSSSK